ncbi:MAG TPA: MinD/ParA family protein [Terriglobales bacterium]|nr:MinD/ParA family protein [Terriglobales bacterium]
MGKTLAFHSYKGGTGKTSLVVNLGAMYAKRGAKVCILDFDFRAPSLNVLFKTKPEFWLNDYLEDKCGIIDTLVDVSDRLHLQGKLWVGFANPTLEALKEIMSKDRKWEVKALSKTLAGKKEILQEQQVDYLIFDTSPGAQYSSINALAGAALISLVMKADEFDLEGTKELAKGVYEALGRKSGIVLNKIPLEQVAGAGGRDKFVKQIESEVGLPLVGMIPCMCELMAYGGKIIYALEKPEHTFTKSIVDIADSLNRM